SRVELHTQLFPLSIASHSAYFPLPHTEQGPQRTCTESTAPLRNQAVPLIRFVCAVGHSVADGVAVDHVMAVVAHKGGALRFVRSVFAVDHSVAHCASRDLGIPTVIPRIEGEAVGVVLVFAHGTVRTTVAQRPPHDTRAVVAVPHRTGPFVDAVQTIRLPVAHLLCRKCRAISTREGRPLSRTSSDARSPRRSRAAHEGGAPGGAPAPGLSITPRGRLRSTAPCARLSAGDQADQHAANVP